MSAELALRNHQRALRLDLRFLRRVVQHLLEAQLSLPEFELGIQFVGARRMAELNQHFLQHEGPTDVITFNHAQECPGTWKGQVRRVPSDSSRASRVGDSCNSSLRDTGSATAASDKAVQGELFICPAVARQQARQFRTTWQEEIVRYLVHGILHLRGFDDSTSARRRVMKRKENRLVRHLACRFTLSKAGRAPKMSA